LSGKKKKPESPGVASKASPGDTGPETSSSSQGGRADEEYAPDQGSANDLKDPPEIKEISLLREVHEAHLLEQGILERAYGRPPPDVAVTPLFLTLDESISVLSRGSKSTLMRDRARAKILRALQRGDVKLGGQGIRGMLRRTRSALNDDRRASACVEAMRIWMAQPKLPVSQVVKQIGIDNEFTGVSERTLRAWITDIKPRN